MGFVISFIGFIGIILLVAGLCCMIPVLMIGAFILMAVVIAVSVSPLIGPLLFIITCVVLWVTCSKNKL